MIRGYHFTAPTNFTICGLEVPADASNASQTVRVVLFNAGAPPAFPGGTNSVTQLFSATNAASGILTCNIPVTTGQIIGVYGSRGACINSYGSANFVTNILGFNTILQKSGMQSCPGPGVPMSNIWSEVALPIGRITMYVNCCIAPTVNTSANTPICSGQTLQLTGTATPAGNYTYNWTGPNGFTSNLLSPSIPNITSSSAGTYTLTVSSPSCGNITSTVVVVVNPTPNLTATSNLVCNGGLGSVLLSASSGIAPYTYGGSPTTALFPGTYTYTATSSQGCISAPVSITITPPSAPINLSTSQTNVSCFGFTNGSINLTPTGGVGPYSFLWSNSLATEDLSNLSVGSYSVLVTDANGCTANIATTITGPASPLSVTIPDAVICSTQSHTFNPQFSVPGGLSAWSTSETSSSITVYPLTTTTYTIAYTLNTCVALDTAIVTVIPTPTLSVNSAAICIGDSVQIASVTNLAGGTYQWNNGLTTPNLTASPTVNPTLYTLIYSLNGCSSIPATSTINVNPIPQLTAAPATICLGQNTTLSATPNLVGGTYLWLAGGETTSTITVSPTLNTIYPVSYTLNGCTSSQANGVVTVTPLPNAIIQSDVELGCSPLVVNFTTDTTNQVASYQWSTNNGGLGSGVNTAISFINPGCYNVTLVATMLGCTTTNTLVDYICVNSEPEANFGASIYTFTEENQNVLFDNSSTGASTYTWNFGDGNSSNDENPSHVYSSVIDGETITLLAFSILGCVDSISITIPYQESELFYIPNTFTPDGDMFNETFMPHFTAGFDIYSYHMEIFNRWGDLVFESFNIEHGWDGSFGLEGVDAIQGTYTYKISINSPSVDKNMLYMGHVNLIR